MKLRKRLAKTISELEFLPLSECDDTQIETIRTIRNLPAIRENMYNNCEIDKAEHASWAAATAKSDTTRFFAILYKGEIAGAVSISRIDVANKRAEWAFYLNDTAHGAGLGPALEIKTLDFAFHDLGLDKLDCEVLEFNTSVISMHKKFGFLEEGRKRARVMRDNKPVAAIMLGITKQEWIEKSEIREKGDEQDQRRIF